jgi:hypothetical protein
MSDRIVLKPVEGRLVRHPSTYKPLAVDGEAVENNSYWIRKLGAGDVVEVETGESAQKPKGAK